jgi:hypothetical protein
MLNQSLWGFIVINWVLYDSPPLRPSSGGETQGVFIPLHPLKFSWWMNIVWWIILAGINGYILTLIPIPFKYGNS